MGKSPKEMADAIVKNLPEKTGKSLDEWLTILAGSGPVSKKERIVWLKTEHELGHVTAQVIAARADDAETGGGYDNPAALLDALYEGPRAGLRPIHDRIVEVAEAELGKIRVTVCKTYVGLSAKTQFAVIKPSTAGRVDLGLALGDMDADGALTGARGLGGSARITHAIALRDPAEVESAALPYLRKAHKLNS